MIRVKNFIFLVCFFILGCASSLKTPHFINNSGQKISKNLKIGVLPISIYTEPYPIRFSSPGAVRADNLFNDLDMCSYNKIPSSDNLRRVLITELRNRGIRAEYADSFNRSQFDYVLQTDVTEISCLGNFHLKSLSLPIILLTQADARSETFVKLNSRLLGANDGMVKEAFINYGYSTPSKKNNVFFIYFYTESQKSSPLESHFQVGLAAVSDSLVKVVEKNAS